MIMNVRAERRNGIRRPAWLIQYHKKVENKGGAIMVRTETVNLTLIPAIAYIYCRNQVQKHHWQSGSFRRSGAEDSGTAGRGQPERRVQRSERRPAAEAEEIVSGTGAIR